ncbi:MAG: YbaK/EbsC family protein [Bryobacterales bacterium]|nr:YbaK/EbsC family protein [Bryobacterales bacterium]
MALLERLRVFLDQNQVERTHTVHPLAYTAREVAAAEHVSAKEMAKAVVFMGDNGYRMAVLPANRLVDFQELRTVLGFSHARLATEHELAQLFPDCELGAMPPFGNLYGIPVYLDSALLQDEMIAFNAGTHRDVVHMHLNDYRRLVQPAVVSLSRELAARNA